ncbi:MAG: DUF4013 domain-containing protein [Deltaproteobacteria bacterium]|nr:DUF4013 domain-containing protein [Deltaproteobacteria bacterium]
MGDLERALRYPFSDPTWKPKFVLGGVFYLLAAALDFVPVIGWLLWFLFALLPLGYGYGVFGNHLRAGEDLLPPWENWGDLFRRGLRVLLLAIAYGILPWAFFRWGSILWWKGGLAAAAGMPFLLLAAGLGGIASYLFPMGLALYTREESPAAGFYFARIWRRIKTVQKDYTIGWLAGWLILLALLFLKIHLPSIGWILYAFGLFFWTLVVARLFGEICRRGLPEAP